MKILSLNCRGLASRLKYIENTTIAYGTSILCLSETMRTSSNPSLNELHFINFHFDSNFHIAKDPNFLHQGTSTYSLCNTVDKSWQIDMNHEIIATEFHAYGKKFLLLNCYLSPSQKDQNSIIDFYKSIIKTLNKYPKHTWILTGDLNSKSNDIFQTRSPNFAGSILNKMLTRSPIDNLKLIKQLTLLNDTPTRSTNACQNLLDVILTSDTNNIKYVQLQSTSDHDALIIEIDPPSIKRQSTTVIDYEKPDMETFNSEIKSITNYIQKLDTTLLKAKNYHKRQIVEKMAKTLCDGIVEATKQQRRNKATSVTSVTSVNWIRKFRL